MQLIKKTKEDSIDKKKWKMTFFYKKKNYLVLLLNRTQWFNLKTSLPDFLFNLNLKLTHMKIDSTYPSLLGKL
jgi:hypothetical protein